ncbi:hypothetical protein C8J56DRAFT_1041046 [Mycena floridula]|nr:hypothetical protein C8J56DRAFT_1041046 [Mycena floridula]
MSRAPLKSRRGLLVLILVLTSILCLWSQRRRRTPLVPALGIVEKRPVLTEYKTLPETTIPHDAHCPGFTMLDNLLKAYIARPRIYRHTPQFLHYYDFWGELLLGARRVYSKLAEDDPKESLPLVDRIMSRNIRKRGILLNLLKFMNDTQWANMAAGINGPLLHAAFPKVRIGVMIVNREASHRSPLSGKWSKMIGGTWDVSVLDEFFEIVRQNVVRNLLGYIRKFDSRGFVASGRNSVAMPIVTYISRQGGDRRTLDARDHDRLVESLIKLERDRICKVVVASMEKMTVNQQIEISAQSTILVGVHGNGLTHQLWMPPGLASMVIEFFVPRGRPYLAKFEILGRNLGFKHYAIWNDTSITYPKGTFHPSPENLPDGFQGTIPVFGPTVVNIIKKRLLEAL